MWTPQSRDCLTGEQTYETVTAKNLQHRAPAARCTVFPWYILMAIGFLLLQVLGTGVTYSDLSWERGYLGHQPAGRLGVRHHQLRLVDRYRPCRNPDLGDPATAAAAVAYLDQPVRRGDDPVCRLLRRTLPTDPYRTSLVRLLDVPLPQHSGDVAAVPQPVCCGTCFAVSTYATVSALFWFVGLIPDLATLRDRAENPGRQSSFSARLPLGWRGSARHWQRYETVYLILAGLSTPLVLSVHSVISFDFSIGIVPGWHATIFPPYFVAGAVYAGFRHGAHTRPSVARLV